jgi:two-component system, cell cycle response regulator
MVATDNTMSGFNILPIGFSIHEKATIETFFRLASQRAPHWQMTSRSSEARVVLFNATSQQDVNAFKSLVAAWQRVVIVGTSDFGTGWAVMQRPLKLTAILNVLNEVLKTDAPAVVVAPVISPLQSPMQSPLQAPFQAPAISQISKLVAAMPETAPVDSTLNEAPSFTAPLSEANILASNPSKNATDVLGRVLIVDDSDIALKFIRNRLRHFGYESELARSGEEALTMVGKNSYQFVFLDVMMAGLDGYKTCRAIKNNKARHGLAPVVVMLTSRGGTIDKIRGTLAGCDAYLTKPLNEQQLAGVLSKFDESTVLQRWEAMHPKAALVDKFAQTSN